MFKSNYIMSDENVQAFRDRVLELLDYNPETGVFAWRKHRHDDKVGKVAGSVCSRDGYVIIYIDCKGYRARRLAWLVMTGNNPIAEIDHIDNDRANNALSNLRAATRMENGKNLSKKVNNVSGYVGVYKQYNKKRWTAEIKCNYVKYRLGYYDSAKEAAIARDKAAIRLHGEYSKLNFRYVVDEEGNVELDE